MTSARGNETPGQTSGSEGRTPTVSLDSLHETLFWLSQPGVRGDVAEAQHELAEGRTVSGADLRTEYGLPAR